MRGLQKNRKDSKMLEKRGRWRNTEEMNKGTWKKNRADRRLLEKGRR